MRKLQRTIFYFHMLIAMSFFPMASYSQAVPAPSAQAASQQSSSLPPITPQAAPAGVPSVNDTLSTVPPSTPPNMQSNSPDADAGAVQMARDQAFNQLTLNALPMTPEQIQKLRNLFADSQRAATAAPGGVPPKAVVSTQSVHLEPGATPPVIRLYQGHVTAVVFLDSTSAPWPIQAYDVGNPSAFNIQWDHASNVMMIQAMGLYTYGNLVVQLKGLSTPISIDLIPGQPFVDYRVDLRVPGYGPNAKPGAATTLPEAAGADLIHVLDGIPPSDKAKVLHVEDSNALAWLFGDKMYLRTHLTLLSPAWIASMSSADGTNAYEIPKTPSILVSNSDGKIYNLRIEGY